MKKIIIALLVVLSVFALVSCSSSEPTVKTENVTLSATSVGTTPGSAEWSVKLNHNSKTYGVWCKDSTGKYVDILTYIDGLAVPSVNAFELKDASGKVFGEHEAKLSIISDTEKTGQYTSETTYFYDEVTLSFTGVANVAGTWTGEVAIATSAVSDTQLSGVVAKYNLTCTNTVKASEVTQVTIDDVVLSTGSTATTGKKDSVTRTNDKIKTEEVTDLFEVVSGGYKYIGTITNGLSIYDPADAALAVKDKTAIGKVTFDITSKNIKFVLADSRSDYKKYATYTVLGSYVLGTSKEVDGVKVLDKEKTQYFVNINTFFEASDTAIKETGDSLSGIKVEEYDENAGLFVKQGAVYVTLNDYYIAGTDKLFGVGKTYVKETGAGTLTRALDITFQTEDAPGELVTKGLGDTTSEVVNAVICSYLGDEDEPVIVKEIANVYLTFTNNLPGSLTLETDSLDCMYTLGANDKLDDTHDIFVWDDWTPIGEGAAKTYGQWVKLSTTEPAKENVKVSGVATGLWYTKTVINKGETTEKTVVTFMIGDGSGKAAEGVLYVAFMPYKTVSEKNVVANATSKFAVGCTVAKSSSTPK